MHAGTLLTAEGQGDKMSPDPRAMIPDASCLHAQCPSPLLVEATLACGSSSALDESGIPLGHSE